jgi:oligopeptide/dipeptide ABC transporter ATP-binding protein
LIAVPATDVLLQVEDLQVGLRGGVPHQVVRGVSLEVRHGEVLGIVGESGSGKSVTALSLVGLLPAALRIAAGSIRFHGEELTAADERQLADIRGRQIGFVFQDPMAALNPVMRIGEQVIEPLLLHHMARRAAATARGIAALGDVGLPAAPENFRRFPHQFSGGMRQRAIIASALISGPELIIADEPTTALDVTVQAQILDLFRQLNRERGVALILISHDLGVVGEICDRLAVMYAGRIVETGNTKDVLAEPQHPYTRALIESLPPTRLARAVPLRAIAGEPPTSDALPAGCAFHPRCRHAVALCRTADPVLAPVRQGWTACSVAAQAGGFGPVERPPAVAAGPDAQAESGPREDDQALLRVEDLRCSFSIPARLPWRRRRQVRALDGVSVSVNRGETLGIVGESGCGKSTLVRCVLRLMEVHSGRILFRGRDVTALDAAALRSLRRHIQPVFQDPYASLNPNWTVRESIAEPLLAQDVRGAEVRRRVDESLELVHLGSGFGGRRPHELSGGQRQRVAIARALVCKPELLVADEPLSSLDVSIQAQIINLLREMQARLRLTIILVSHDLRIVRYLSTRIAVMYLGKVVESGDAEEVCAHPRHPYTAALLSAVPAAIDDQSRAKRILLVGELPSPLAPPSGCRFRTRCPMAQPLCAAEEPVPAPGSPVQVACHYPLAPSRPAPHAELGRL